MRANPSAVQPQEQSLREMDLDRICNASAVAFLTEDEMRVWLAAHDIDLTLADSRKGLSKLFHKIEGDEARLVYDEPTKTVYRVARAAKIAVSATIHGDKYPLVELCQIFLNHPIEPGAIGKVNPEEVADFISKLDVRSAQVRNSQELWETLVADEDPAKGVLRGLEEELRLNEGEVDLVDMNLLETSREYEDPIDWPGIASVLDIHAASAVLPESISKPAYAELEGNDQITIFVATPSGAIIHALLAKVIPDIHFVSRLS